VTLAFALPFGFYVLALIAYALHFRRRTPAAGRAATTLLVAGAIVHTFVIGMQTMESGHVPFAGTTQAISTFVWLLALAYLYTEVTTDERGLGVFVLAIVVALQSVPALRGADVEPQSAVLGSPLFWTHVAALLGAYASFGLAAVIGVTYVLQFKEIKAKHLVFFFNRLPSLQVLDVMNSRTVSIGWLLMTIGLGAGAMWVSEASALAPDDPRVQAMSLGDPKIFVAIVTWAVYTFQLVARRTIGWHGRRAAYVSALGFAIVLLNFVLVSYFLTDSHNFAGLRPDGAPWAQGPAVGRTAAVFGRLDSVRERRERPSARSMAHVPTARHPAAGGPPPAVNAEPSRRAEG
jgi:ABC-type transport system involved in cytochrome c biogenesis permease subunit